MFIKINVKKKIIVILFTCACNFAMSQQLFVSPDGKDTNIGSIQSPFASLNKAKEAIRALKQANKKAAGTITVFLRAGNYFIKSGITFTPDDSGDKNNPVIYRAYDNEKVNLIGGVIVEPKFWKQISGPALKRINPKISASKLVELDVASLALANVKKFAPGNQFTTDWYIVDLFANGLRQQVSQWPNPGETIKSVDDPGWTTCNGSKNEAAFYFGKGGKPQDKDTTDEVNADGTHRAQRWKETLDSGHELWLKGLWRTSWEPITMKVKDIDLNDNSISFYEQPPSGMGSKYSPVANQKPLWRLGSGKEDWFAINYLDEIDQPGEWALDFKDGKIYYYPPYPIGELTMMIADMKEPVIGLDNVSDIQFIGLNIQGSLSDGIRMNDCHNVSILGCSITNIGNTGIAMTGGSGNSIRSNDISETGGWGIQLKNLGSRQKLIDSKVTVINNHIHHVGQLAYKEALIIENSVGVLIAHNLLHDIPKGAVRTDGINNCIFEFNEVHNNALKEGDTGTFYSYGGWANYGNIYRYNFTHHTIRSNGFYCDDGDSGDWFYKNIEQGLISGVKFGGGHDNLADNNLIVESKDQTIDDRGKDRNYRLGTKYETNLTRFNLKSEPWLSFGRQIKQQNHLSTNLWNDILNPEWHPEYPNGSRINNNVAVASGKFQKPANGNVELNNNTTLSTIAEAGFYDYKQMDLRTNNKSVLEKFPELNEIFLQIGLQKDEYRLKLPSRKETGGLVNRQKAADSSGEDQFIDKVKR